MQPAPPAPCLPALGAAPRRGRLQQCGTRNQTPPPPPAGSAAALRFYPSECLTAAGSLASPLQASPGPATPGGDTVSSSSRAFQSESGALPGLASTCLCVPSTWSPPLQPSSYLSARHQLLESTSQILLLCGRTRTQRYLSGSKSEVPTSN